MKADCKGLPPKSIIRKGFMVLKEVRGETKFLNESYKSYGEEETEVSTKKFPNNMNPVVSNK